MSFCLLGWVPTGTYAVLQQAIRGVEGLQSEACVPPVLFAFAGIVPREASILNLTYILGGSSAV
jgi:hypothetical protein